MTETTLSEEDRQAAKQRLALTLRAAAFGEVVALLMRSTSHRQMPISELGTLVAPPVLLDQYLVAKKTDVEAAKGGLLVGVVFWAKVSDEIDAQIRSDLNKPIRLPFKEWNSGPHHWIVDLIAIDGAKGALLRDTQKRVGDDVPINVRSANAEGAPEARLLSDMMAAAAAAANR